MEIIHLWELHHIITSAIKVSNSRKKRKKRDKVNKILPEEGN